MATALFLLRHGLTRHTEAAVARTASSEHVQTKIPRAIADALRAAALRNGRSVCAEIRAALAEKFGPPNG
jgi:hypothetical protein